MFGSLSFNEILFIMVLALLIFGPKRLPQIGRTIGKTLGEFRRATGDLKRSMEVEMTMAEERETAAGAPSPRLVADSEPRRQAERSDKADSAARLRRPLRGFQLRGAQLRQSRLRQRRLRQGRLRGCQWEGVRR